MKPVPAFPQALRPRRRQNGSAILLTVLLVAALGLFAAGAAKLQLERYTKGAAQDKAFRSSDDLAQSALELIKTLIAANTLLKDSVTGQWSYGGASSPVHNRLVAFQPNGVAWEETQPAWVVEALKARELAKKTASLKLRGKSASLASADPSLEVPNPYTSAPAVPTLLFNLPGGTPIVELVKPNAKGEEISIFVDAKPFPKTVRARVGGICEDFDPEPLAMLYRNFLGREPTWKEASSFYNPQNFPIGNPDLLSVESVLGGNGSSVVRDRAGKTGRAMVSELFKMYLAKENPSDDEVKYLVDQLASSSMTFAQTEASMKTSPVYLFTNSRTGTPYYTADEAAARTAAYADGTARFAFKSLAFFVFGKAALPPFAPPTEMSPLHSCYNESGDLHFLSFEAGCPNPTGVSGTSKLVEKLGYVFTDSLAASPVGIAFRPALPISGSGSKEAYVAPTDNRLASAIGLYRVYAHALGEDPYTYGRSFALAKFYDPSFRDADALQWLAQTAKSYKTYHDRAGCGATTAPAPKCFFIGPSQVPPCGSAAVRLYAYGEFTSAQWDGSAVSIPEESQSKVGDNGYIPSSAKPLDTSRTFAPGVVSTSATVSLKVNGKTVSTTCTMPARSVELKVVPNYRGNPDYVVNRNAKPYGYNPDLYLSYSTQGFQKVSCLIVSGDKTFYSAPLTQTQGTVLVKDGIAADTNFTISCTGDDHTRASHAVTAHVFPVPACALSGCLTTTAGYPTSLTLSAPSTLFPDQANWDGALVSSFPYSKAVSGGQTTATVMGPGGASTCSANVTVLPVPPDICTTTCTAAGSAGNQMRCYSTCVPAPIPPPSNCTAPPACPGPGCPPLKSTAPLCSPPTGPVCPGPDPSCPCVPGDTRPKCQAPSGYRVPMNLNCQYNVTSSIHHVSGAISAEGRLGYFKQVRTDGDGSYSAHGVVRAYFVVNGHNYFLGDTIPNVDGTRPIQGVLRFYVPKDQPTNQVQTVRENIWDTVNEVDIRKYFTDPTFVLYMKAHGNTGYWPTSVAKCNGRGPMDSSPKPDGQNIKCPKNGTNAVCDTTTPNMSSPPAPMRYSSPQVGYPPEGISGPY